VGRGVNIIEKTTFLNKIDKTVMIVSGQSMREAKSFLTDSIISAKSINDTPTTLDKLKRTSLLMDAVNILDNGNLRISTVEKNLQPKSNIEVKASSIGTTSIEINGHMKENDNQQGHISYGWRNSSRGDSWKFYLADPDGGYGVKGGSLEIWEYPSNPSNSRPRFTIGSSYGLKDGVTPVRIDSLGNISAKNISKMSEAIKALKEQDTKLQNALKEQNKKLQETVKQHQKRLEIIKNEQNKLINDKIESVKKIIKSKTCYITGSGHGEATWYHCPYGGSYRGGVSIDKRGVAGIKNQEDFKESDHFWLCCN
jgi:hypothetical protein